MSYSKGVYRAKLDDGSIILYHLAYSLDPDFNGDPYHYVDRDNYEFIGYGTIDAEKTARVKQNSAQRYKFYCRRITSLSKQRKPEKPFNRYTALKRGKS